MFKRRRKPASVEGAPAELREGEHLRLRLSAFGEGAAPNPVKEQIVTLRELRNAGRLGPAEFAERVAAVLLGTSESTASYVELGE